MMVGVFPAWQRVPAPAAAAFACRWMPSLVLSVLLASLGRGGAVDAHSRLPGWEDDA